MNGKGTYTATHTQLATWSNPSGSGDGEGRKEVCVCGPFENIARTQVYYDYDYDIDLPTQKIVSNSNVKRRASFDEDTDWRRPASPGPASVASAAMLEVYK